MPKGVKGFVKGDPETIAAAKKGGKNNVVNSKKSGGLTMSERGFKGGMVILNREGKEFYRKIGRLNNGEKLKG